MAGDEVSLSRRAPGFSAVGTGETGSVRRRPLDHSSVSREPLRLTRDPSSEAIRLELSRRALIVANGEALSGAQAFSAAEVEGGVVLSVGHHVVLLLHLLDPSNVPSLPRYGLIGESAAMAILRLQIHKVSDLDVPVLLRGETGTGKELVARAIHDASRRSGSPFLAVNMAAIPPTLAAAELFGAARGAYTGADRRRSGFFAQADNGTLFLDEIGETPPEVQALLLRALETQEIRPVGSADSRRVDVRLVSATDADLESDVAAERFRAPLLYRLGGFELHLPPLRQRRDDFGRLFVHFLCQELAAIGESHRLEPGSGGGPTAWLAAEAVARLAAYDWPGNVRQLRNVTRQLVISSRGEQRARLPESVEMLLAVARPAASGPRRPEQSPAARRKPSEITDDDLVELLRAHRFNLRSAAAAAAISRTSLYALIEDCPLLRKPADLDRDEITATLERVDGDVDAAAAELEVSSLGLKRRLKSLGLR